MRGTPVCNKNEVELCAPFQLFDGNASTAKRLIVGMRRNDEGGGTPIDYIEGGKLRLHTTIEHTAYSSPHPIHWRGPLAHGPLVPRNCPCLNLSMSTKRKND